MSNSIIADDIASVSRIIENLVSSGIDFIKAVRNKDTGKYLVMWESNC